jgi:hypothetical protein
VQSLTIPVVTTVAMFDAWRRSDFDAVRAAVLGDSAVHADTADERLSAPAAVDPVAARQRWWRRRAKR